MIDLITTIPVLLLLVYVVKGHFQRQAWQSRYDAVEQTAIEISHSRMKPIPLS
ncbi:MAG: hypothetical protein HON68_01950 [Gammaproteobacteria bacterium]|jgi:hypothetical protein|nr:hypothetical protein [Gammaproteobacteria bacterium]MBT3488669.1 hypothetical protein [Gammaproteobacteria bacterium]MBT3717512.1 hypothetical protein [Gammaproteobacteria bacterium]MBT3844700.1 hypothetical protein [Gammaproteobacteria bacterium]MBT3892604.1 hypothetical protein [Gammaproteobacteria bacterium]